jgi:RNA polymerase sigma-70 factor, ECF subfamily
LDTSADEKIVELCARGDARAFELLVETYGRRLYSFLFRMTADHAAADEVLQETFVKAAERIGSFRRGADFRGWLYRIAYNECIDYLRSERRRSGRERLYAARRAVAGPQHTGTEEAALAREQAGRIREMLLALPEGQRTAICLFAVEGFSIREIAAVTGCAKGTVMSHLHRARRALRERLAKDIE